MTELHKAISPRTNAEMAEDWNRLAEERHRQITSGDDLSFHHVIVPAALHLLENCDRDYVLDIGSGTGEFTERLAQISRKIVAVEPSQASTEIAKSIWGFNKNIDLIESSIESIVDQLVDLDFTCATANMSLMTATNLSGVVQAISKILSVGTHVVATIPHPVFWPRYRGYEEESWYDYKKEIYIEAPFFISKCSTSLLTTHIHRSLEQYLSVFSEFGFLLDNFIEPVPNLEIQKLYPEPWCFPRFVGLKWTKQM